VGGCSPHPHLVVKEAKDGPLYLVNADHMSKLGSPVQTIVVYGPKGPGGSQKNGLWGAMSF
jgi:hypothetical protein